MPGPDNTTGSRGFALDPRTLVILAAIVAAFAAGAVIVYFAMR